MIAIGRDVKRGRYPYITPEQFINELFPLFFRGKEESQEQLRTSGYTSKYKFDTISYDDGKKRTHDMECFVKMDLGNAFFGPTNLEPEGTLIRLNLINMCGEYVYDLYLTKEFLGEEFVDWLNKAVAAIFDDDEDENESINNEDGAENRENEQKTNDTLNSYALSIIKGSENVFSKHTYDCVLEQDLDFEIYNHNGDAYCLKRVNGEIVSFVKIPDFDI